LGIGGAFGAGGCDIGLGGAEVFGIDFGMFEGPLFFAALEDDGTESTTYDSSLFALISAKNGNAPPVAGGVGASDSVLEAEGF
jgi:hypothetical protein